MEEQFGWKTPFSRKWSSMEDDFVFIKHQTWRKVSKKFQKFCYNCVWIKQLNSWIAVSWATQINVDRIYCTSVLNTLYKLFVYWKVPDPVSHASHPLPHHHPAQPGHGHGKEDGREILFGAYKGWYELDFLQTNKNWVDQINFALYLLYMASFKVYWHFTSTNC